MKLSVISHKICWKSDDSESGYATDGGFPLQIGAISELFAETTVVVPCQNTLVSGGILPVKGKNLRVSALSVPSGEGFRRKAVFPFWLVKNGWKIFNEVRRADAVHTPIPGDIGTIGMFIAILLKKPLFVRHCGNWMVPKTAAERFWRWSMERFAGGRNVMLATGGSNESPSKNNPHIKWIFSTSLRERDFDNVMAKKHPSNGNLRLVIACRQEKNKGTEVVIDSLPLIREKLPNVMLDIIGDGSLLTTLKEQVRKLNLTDYVVFHGKVQQDKVITLMRAADIFCYPTMASEGFPKVVLEALAAGLPVIATRVSVLAELIKDECGILLDKPAPEDVAAAVLEIADDPNAYEKYSDCAVKKAKEFRWKAGAI